MKLSKALLLLALASATDAFTFVPTGSIHRLSSLNERRTNNNVKITSTSLPAHVNSKQSNLKLNNSRQFDSKLFVQHVAKGLASTLLALTVSLFNTFGPLQNLVVEPAFAADGKAIGLCLLQKCRLPLAKCIINPNCLANVICINSCNGKENETGCQIKCGDIFENSVVGEFNKCAVSDMDCVPTRPDDGSYPIPPPEVVVPKFNTNLWNGRWYITAGQNELFDIFPCQVHFFTETEPGKFIGKLNWRIQEPDGEFFTRDAVQEFVQDPKQPGHLINHDNEYLHYEDDWYVIDYAEDNNKEGVPPFAFIYYRGANDAWIGYGGAVIYTRDSQLPPEIIPRLREAAKKVNFDFDKDFTVTDNTCTEISEGERILLREKFAGKAAIQTEEQIQAAIVRVRGNAVNRVKARQIAADGEIEQTKKAVEELQSTVDSFEKEIVKDIVIPLEQIEKKIVEEVEIVEKEVEQLEKELFGIFQKK
jgi:violaxanthin de-epoxidase